MDMRAATRRSALSSETVGGGVLLALSFETEQISMVEDRYPSFFQNSLQSVAKKCACGWWIGPCQTFSGICRRPGFLFGLWTIPVYFP